MRENQKKTISILICQHLNVISFDSFKFHSSLRRARVRARARHPPQSTPSVSTYISMVDVLHSFLLKKKNVFFIYCNSYSITRHFGRFGTRLHNCQECMGGDGTTCCVSFRVTWPNRLLQHGGCPMRGIISR